MPRQLSKQDFSRGLWRAIVPPLLLVAAHAVLLSLVLLYWMRANDAARHSEHAVFAANNLERLLYQIDSSVRGFRLTSSQSVLVDYEKNKQDVPLAIEELAKLIDGNVEQNVRLSALKGMFAKWQSLEDACLQRAGPTDPNGILEQATAMREIHAQLATISAAESFQKSVNYSDQRQATITAVLGGIGFSMAMGVTLALINRRTVINLSSAYQQALDEEVTANRQFADLADAVPQLVWISDGAGKDDYFNEPWSHFTQLPAHHLKQRGWLSVVADHHATDVQKQWQASLGSGEPFETECQLQPDGTASRQWFLCRALPVKDKSGRATRWFGSCTNIEAQKQLAAQREKVLAEERQAHSELIRSDRVKDEFLATLSHELRTPMTAILGWAKLLRDPHIRSTMLDRAIDAIDGSSRTQARLIDDLLDMSRVMSGKLSIKSEPIDFRPVVQAAIESVTPAASNKKLTLSFLAEESGDLIVHGDAGRLQQVVWNLLTNAVKFTPSGGTVSVSLRRSGESVRFTVTDTGQGIDSEFLQHVFERFRQADGTTTRVYGGLGLGLAIVKNLIELHGGTVSAHSDGAGTGSTFSFDLPLAGTPASSRLQETESVDASVLAGRRILVVEDDVDAAFVLQTILEQSSASVIAVASVAEAMAVMHREKIDLVFSDIGMPGTDGYALISQIRSDSNVEISKLPVVALTAFARPEDRAEAHAAGFDAHLAKPVTPRDLQLCAEAMLRSKPQ